MDIETAIAELIRAKKGNKDAALFHNDGHWTFALGNPVDTVMLGEVNGEIETYGANLSEIVWKMQIKFGRHTWKIVSVGGYDTLYCCTRCRKVHQESIDNPATELPLFGCEARQEEKDDG